MSDRYLKNPSYELAVPVATATGFEEGDLLALSSGQAYEAAAETWDTDLATTQANFVAKFLGVSRERKVATVARIYGASQDNIVAVSSAGTFEFDCASATFAVGDLVGPAKQTGNALENQKVVAVGHEGLAIGRVVRAGTSVTKVEVQLLSRHMPLSLQGFGAPISAQQTLAAGGGAVSIYTFYTAGASDAGGDAWTLADGLFYGQVKKIRLITDGGGDATLTPTSLSGGTTITFADAGDTAILVWNGSDWVPVELSNDADGATAPVLA